MIFFWGVVLFLCPQMTKYRKKHGLVGNMILSNQMLSIFAAHLSLKVLISHFQDCRFTVYIPYMGYTIWTAGSRFGAKSRLGRTGSPRRFKVGRASKVNSLNLGSLAVKFLCQKYWDISNISKCDKQKEHFPAGHHSIFLCKKPTEWF